MRRPWSISTTVRNPERLRNFLRVLKKIEGENFTKNNQIKYQILLIKERLYKPLNIPEKHQNYYNDPKLTMPFKVAEEIFENQRYNDPPMRGRQSVNPINKLGFAIAREGYGKIRITKLGNLFLKGDYDIGLVFFKSLLKLQFPNPWSKDFSTKNGFNIIPFIATLHLIKKLNEKSSVKGLSKNEFSLFIPTLINAKQINEQIKKILNYRKISDRKRKQKFIKEFAMEFYQKENLPSQKIKNLFDYGDNIMRYFRLTRYFRIKSDPLGLNWRITLEPLRMVEINQILSQYNGEAFQFSNIVDYLNYISDINKPELPWEKIENLRNIASVLHYNIVDTIKKKNISLSYEKEKILKVKINSLDKALLNEHILKLRNINREIKLTQKKKELLGNKKRIIDIIEIMEDQKSLKKISPETFEKIITETLKIINDELLIKPNYPTDDEGEPISHAPGNKADIECYYNSFKAIFEVTLNTSNFQWIQEGQPVMRHLRNFEKNNNSEKNIYCIFIAPKIHDDTYSQFWFSVKYEYDGAPQKIIPLTTKQLALLLKKFLKNIERKKKFTHRELFILYKSIIEDIHNINGFSEWKEKINKTIKSWTVKEYEN